MTILYITLAAVCAAVIWAALRPPKKRGYPRSGGGEIHPLYLAEYIRSRAWDEEIEITHRGRTFRVRHEAIAVQDDIAYGGWLVTIEPGYKMLVFSAEAAAWLILSLEEA